MAHEIINTLRSKSIVRVTGNTATAISLANLSAAAAETVTDASIAYVASTTDGKWSVYRGTDATGTLILELYGNTHLPFVHYDISFANTSNAGIYVTNSGSGGTLILQLSKATTYNPALVGM